MTNQIAAVESLRSRIIRILEERSPENPYMDMYELYDTSLIREVCNDSNKLSMMLSDMSRAKLLTRVPASRKGTNVKFAYGSLKVVGAKAVKDNTAAETKGTKVAEKVEPPKKEVTVTSKKDKITPSAKVKAKPNIRVTEHTVTIETESVRIVVELY